MFWQSICELIFPDDFKLVMDFTTFCFFSFIIHMRIVNTICISKETAVQNLTGMGFECELSTSKSGIRLDQVFMHRGEMGGGKVDFLQTS